VLTWVNVTMYSESTLVWYLVRDGWCGECSRRPDDTGTNYIPVFLISSFACRSYVLHIFCWRKSSRLARRR